MQGRGQSLGEYLADNKTMESVVGSGLSLLFKTSSVDWVGERSVFCCLARVGTAVGKL